MIRWLSDATLAHLRDVADWPDAGDRYEILGRLGRGGMGVVYAARDRLLDRDVALKVLDVTHADDAAERLAEEARILGRLEHPGVVPVHDAGRLSDGRPFYVMKLVRGSRLDEAVAATASIPERLELFLRICDAVSFAHAQGIVHRDLKPQNIMLGSFGEVLVMDWGVARVLHSTGRGQPGVVGTPGFMAPEQERGDSAGADQRADVFALGTILNGLLADPAPRPLAAIVRQARQNHPRDRYPTVEALAQDVARFRDGDPVSAYRESVLERAGRFYTRYRLPILLVVAYMIMRTVLLLWRGV